MNDSIILPLSHTPIIWDAILEVIGCNNILHYETEGVFDKSKNIFVVNILLYAF
jgi:hypothetical protein